MIFLLSFKAHCCTIYNWFPRKSVSKVLWYSLKVQGFGPIFTKHFLFAMTCCLISEGGNTHCVWRNYRWVRQTNEIGRGISRGPCSLFFFFPAVTHDGPTGWKQITKRAPLFCYIRLFPQDWPLLDNKIPSWKQAKWVVLVCVFVSFYWSFMLLLWRPGLKVLDKY